ncbi:MAG TPA: energy transducer TonB [Pyrinomonadaceae bacterium]|jgi:hypothetical protein
MSRKLIFTFIITSVVLMAGFQAIATVTSDPAAAESPAVVAAMSLPYPGVALVLNVSGEVTVEVTINPKGEAISVKATGHRLLVVFAEGAAKQWRFAPTADSTDRVATLVFSFKIMPNCTPAADLTPIFYPPYKLEVRGEQKPPIPSDVSPSEWERLRCKNPK